MVVLIHPDCDNKVARQTIPVSMHGEIDLRDRSRFHWVRYVRADLAERARPAPDDTEG